MNDQNPTTGFRPMKDYPRVYDPGPGVWWGPTVLVRVPVSPAWPYHPVYYVAHLEANMWLMRCGSEPEVWDSLYAEPEAWMPIEGVTNNG